MHIYLGDGVYAQYTGEEIILYTSDGINTTNKIYLDIYSLDILVKFISEIKGEGLINGK